MQIGVFDVMEDGSVRAVPLEEVPDFTRPPEGLSRQVRRQWERHYRNFIQQYGMGRDMAWYRASRLVLGKRIN